MPTIIDSCWDKVWLGAKSRPEEAPGGGVIRAVDLFCGSGGMTLGVWEAARRLGVNLEVRLAIDSDARACRVYRANFPRAQVVTTDVNALFSGEPGKPATPTEARLSDHVGPLDLLIGGPPCQGHSDLNNHTRRQDPKNALYLRMARAAEALKPTVVVIENVAPVQWDADDVVGACEMALGNAGYEVYSQVLDLSRCGVPQRRRRFIMLAVRRGTFAPKDILTGLMGPTDSLRDVAWAIKDIEDIDVREGTDVASKMSAENVRRIGFLFEHELHDLPNSERPDCHKNDHSYKSMYGRLWWDRPAQTITTGFTSIGQGRYIHPSQRRTITPHEAARLQTFPDWFDWSHAVDRRTALTKLIGNAVPPLMMTQLTGAFMNDLLES